jgi:hypothetical protein
MVQSQPLPRLLSQAELLSIALHQQPLLSSPAALSDTIPWTTHRLFVPLEQAAARTLLWSTFYVLMTCISYESPWTFVLQTINKVYLRLTSRLTPLTRSDQLIPLVAIRLLLLQRDKHMDYPLRRPACRSNFCGLTRGFWFSWSPM